jgi:hypothetical protein
MAIKVAKVAIFAHKELARAYVDLLLATIIVISPPQKEQSPECHA